MNEYPAPGKLNLFLHVLGRRPDGYHELQTVFRLIDRTDRIRISPRRDGEIVFSGPFGDENLCVRAARALKQETGTRLGTDIALEKRLPVGGADGLARRTAWGTALSPACEGRGASARSPSCASASVGLADLLKRDFSASGCAPKALTRNKLLWQP